MAIGYSCSTKFTIIIMEPLYKIKKGLDIRLVGEPELRMEQAPLSAIYALQPEDFYGVAPRLKVKEGDSVLAGSPVFVDKATERIQFVSPVSGTVKAIVRGDRRKLLRIEIAADRKQAAKEFDVPDLGRATREEVLSCLLQTGLFAYFRQRPYDVTASPADQPKAVFVSAFSKMPLAADFSFVAQGQEQDFQLGLRVLAKLAPVHLGISPEQINTPLLPVPEVSVSVFEGPNPAGNVGVQINHVSPVNKGEVVWTLGAEEVLFIGRLFRTGRVDFTRRVAVGGSRVTAPCYVEAIVGAALGDVFGSKLSAQGHVRVVNGNPLVGVRTSAEGYLAAHSTEVCALPEGDDADEWFGWIRPRLNDFSTSRSYFSWLQPHSRRYDLDCRVKGGERHMIMSAEYERVFPMDIYPSYLIKAIISGDIDRQEALGIYEVAPEDFAVAEFICSSKLELQRIVREGLDILRKENA